MRPYTLIFSLLVCVCTFAQERSDLQQIASVYGFIENKGQVVDQHFLPNPAVRYILPLPNNNVVLTATGFSYDTYVVEQDGRIKPTQDTLMSVSSRSNQQAVDFKFHRVDVEFVGGNPEAEIIPMEQSYDFVTYYVGAAGTETKVYHYKKLLYKGIYDGIDLEFVARPGKDKPVEYNFIVKPGADASQIKLSYRGAHKNELKGGKLELSLSHGMLTESIPASFWKESKKIAKVVYKELKTDPESITIGFQGESVRKNETLVIDPTPALSWGTYFGGAEYDYVNGGDVDASNNVYAAGTTQSATMIGTSGAHQAVFGGLGDAFLVKFNASGVRQWATYYGGANGDYASSVKIDPSGNVLLAGSTMSPTSIATPGAFQTTGGTSTSYYDAFIVKFNSNGTRQWGTYFGIPAGSDEAYDIAFYGSDIIYVNGLTSSTSGIATAGSHQPALGGGIDAFLVKFDAAGTRLWASYYGGEGAETGNQGICTDQAGNVYITGSTQSTTMMSTPGAHQVSFNGTANAFLAKFDPNGVRQWGTYYGAGNTGGLEVASDGTNNVYLVGPTFSSTSISTSGSHQPSYGGAEDGYVAKFNSSGVRQWATYYGGTNFDVLSSVTVDASSNVYVAGYTRSTNSIATTNAYQTVHGGSSFDDALLVKFNSAGVRQWGTYYGGPQQDDAYDVSVLSSGDVYIVGATASTTSISTLGSYQTTHGGLTDGFIAKFTPSPCTAPEANGLVIQDTPNICAVKFSTAKLTNCLVMYAWNFGDGGTSIERNPVHVYAAAGTYNVSVQINYNCSGCQNQTTLTKQITYTVPTSLLEDRIVDVSTTSKNDVITTSASSFSDSWPMNHQNATLDSKSPFVNGARGVWRNDATFVYEKDRKLSPSTTIATDGTFTMEQFNWKNADLNAVPNWVKATAMTRYSPYSFELENKDVLGVYTGAIYDYGGQLPVANGSNMRQDEMAFTSFEYLDGPVGGNWILSAGSLPAYVQYNIPSGNANMAIVEASLTQLAGVVAVDVITPILIAGYQFPRTYTQNEIVCLKAHPQNPAWSIVVLRSSPTDGLWKGQLRIKNIVTPAIAPVVDNTVWHTGKKSLKITAETTLKQEILRLDAGKSYWINSWVSINNPSTATPVYMKNLGIEIQIIAHQKNGTTIATFPFQPTGPVIEGWQQIKGPFVCPANTEYIEIKFKPGTSGTVYFDDLRIQPEGGNMKGYVYNPIDFRLQAVLDEENFASFFYYDKEGNLYLTKKETTDGVKTLSENITYQFERN